MMKRYISLLLYLISTSYSLAQQVDESPLGSLETDKTILLYNVDFDGYLVGGNDYGTQASLSKTDVWKVRLERFTMPGEMWDGMTYLIKDSVQTGNFAGQWRNVFIENTGKIYVDQTVSEKTRDSLWTITWDRNTYYYKIGLSPYNSFHNPKNYPNRILGARNLNEATPAIEILPSSTAQGTNWDIVDGSNHSSLLGESRLRARKMEGSVSQEIDFSDLISLKFLNDNKKSTKQIRETSHNIVANNTTFDIYQKVYGVPYGYYRLDVPAFCLNSYPDYAWLERDSAIVLSELYANDMAIPLKNVMSEPSIKPIDEKDWLALDGTYFPINNNYDYKEECPSLTDGRYKNTIYFKVVDGRITFGFRQNKVRYGCATVFKNKLKLTYLGTDETVLAPAFKQYQDEIDRINSVCRMRSVDKAIDKAIFNYTDQTYTALKDMSNAVCNIRNELLNDYFTIPVIQQAKVDNSEAQDNQANQLTDIKLQDMNNAYEQGMLHKFDAPESARVNLIKALSLGNDLFTHSRRSPKSDIHFKDDLLPIELTISGLYSAVDMRDSAEYYLNLALKRYNDYYEEEYMYLSLSGLTEAYEKTPENRLIYTSDIKFDKKNLSTRIALCQTRMAFMDSTQGRWSKNDRKEVKKEYLLLWRDLADAQITGKDSISAVTSYQKILTYATEYKLINDEHGSLLYNAIEKISEIYSTQGKQNEGIALIQTYLPYFKKMDDKLYYGNLYNILIDLYDAVGNYVEVEKCYPQIIEYIKKRKGDKSGHYFYFFKDLSKVNATEKMNSYLNKYLNKNEIIDILDYGDMSAYFLIRDAKYLEAVENLDFCIQLYDYIKKNMKPIEYLYKQPVFVYKKALCHAETGRMDLAKPLLEYSIETRKQLVEHNSKYDSDLLWNFNHIIELYQRANMLPEQLDILMDWTSYCKKRPSVYGEIITTTLLPINSVCKSLLSANQYLKAIEAISFAIQECPAEDKAVLANLYDTKGEILLRQGNTDEALLVWKKVMELCPDFLQDNQNGTELYNGLKKKNLEK